MSSYYANFSLSLTLSLQRHCSPGWTSASFKSFLHPSRFRATTVQFLHPSLAASSFTPSSQRSLGLPLGRFPPGPLRRTLLDKSSSSWRMTTRFSRYEKLLQRYFHGKSFETVTNIYIYIYKYIYTHIHIYIYVQLICGVAVICRPAQARPFLPFVPRTNNIPSEHIHRMLLLGVAVTTEQYQEIIWFRFWRRNLY